MYDIQSLIRIKENKINTFLMIQSTSKHLLSIILIVMDYQ